MINLILTDDNRLIVKNGTKTAELMGYVTEFYLDELIKNINGIKKKYLINTIGQPGLVRLTDKQWQVVRFWQDGLKNSEIAKQLRISHQAVANLKKRVVDKVHLLQQDQNFRLKTEAEYQALWSRSRLYKVQYIQQKSISDLDGGDCDDDNLENVFFSDDGQDASVSQGAIMREEILSMLDLDERQLACWLEDGYTPKECHAMLIKQGKKLALISVYKMIYRIREKLKGYNNEKNQFS